MCQVPFVLSCRNIVGQVMLDLFCKDFLGEMFDSHIKKSFDMDEGPEGLLKRLLSSKTSFMTPLATFQAYNGYGNGE